MKKIIFVLITSLALVSPQMVFAHILKTSGNFGVTLHIDPDDDPIANSQSGFFFEIKDKSNKFKPENCNCIVTVTEGGKQLYSGSLFQNTTDPSLTDAAFFYTFPQKDVYTVDLTGNPATTGSFDPFHVSYDVRVDRDAGVSSQPTTAGTSSGWLQAHVVHLIGGGVVLVFFIFALIKQSRDAKNKKPVA